MIRLQRLAQLRALWDAISTSLWFVPLVMMGAGVLLAVLGFGVDSRLTGRDPQTIAWWVYTASTDNARELVSTLLSSMITMTTLVFSVTMVVLTLAANQFGPRLIRNFMASRFTQGVLGTFLMTILYCLLVLSAVGWRSGDGPLPFASISLAVALMAASLVLLLLFIHILARSIVSETIIDRVGRELDTLVDDLGPALPEHEARAQRPEDQLPEDFEALSTRFGPGAAGYVQAIEYERLVSVASDAEVLVGLYFRAGDYVVEGGRGIAVYPATRCNSRLARAIDRTITVGIHRTPVQDPEFAVRHLVEIAVRALSPGINDPYTAVAVLHRISASLSRIMRKALPEGVFRDAGGAVRVICPHPTYASLINGAFDQIRQNGADKPLVVIHLLEAIIRIADHTTMRLQADALREQLEIILEATDRAIASPSDRADVKRRFEKAQEAVNQALLMHMASN